MVRTIIKIGDVFSVPIDADSKKYFQYVANDRTQLNSDVIIAFKKAYSISETPSLLDIPKDQVDFYAHCVIKWGIKMKLWEKVGNSPILAKTRTLFRHTNDHGSKPGQQIEISTNWFIWKINDEKFTSVGELKGEHQKAEIGMVINPASIVHRMRTGEYNFVYPGY